jgi:hypothetical protein
MNINKNSFKTKILAMISEKYQIYHVPKMYIVYFKIVHHILKNVHHVLKNIHYVHVYYKKFQEYLKYDFACISKQEGAKTRPRTWSLLIF